jgi:hypothetical protein
MNKVYIRLVISFRSEVIYVLPTAQKFVGIGVLESSSRLYRLLFLEYIDGVSQKYCRFNFG